MTRRQEVVYGFFDYQTQSCGACTNMITKLQEVAKPASPIAGAALMIGSFAMSFVARYQERKTNGCSMAFGVFKRTKMRSGSANPGHLLIGMPRSPWRSSPRGLPA